jgi:hypothetical protein
MAYTKTLLPPTRSDLVRDALEQDKEVFGQIIKPTQASERSKAITEMAFEKMLVRICKSIEEGQTWDQKLKIYKQFKQNTYDVEKEAFNNAQREIVDGNITPQTVEKLKSASLRYYLVTQQIITLQEHLFSFLELEEQQLKELPHKEQTTTNFLPFYNHMRDLQNMNAEISPSIQSFKQGLDEATIEVAVKLMTDPDKKTIPDLKTFIPHIKLIYDNAYKNSNFWGFKMMGAVGWLKSVFRKSERYEEIEFLDAISMDTRCTESIRAEAIKLVKMKIHSTETFGAGSKLATILENVPGNNTSGASKSTEKGLDQFLKEPPKFKMPASLRAYYEDQYKIDLKTPNIQQLD